MSKRKEENRRRRARQKQKENRMQRNAVHRPVEQQSRSKKPKTEKASGGFRDRTLKKLSSLLHKDDAKE